MINKFFLSVVLIALFFSFRVSAQCTYGKVEDIKSTCKVLRTIIDLNIKSEPGKAGLAAFVLNYLNVFCEVGQDNKDYLNKTLAQNKKLLNDNTFININGSLSKGSSPPVHQASGDTHSSMPLIKEVSN